MANCEFCKLQDNCPGLDDCVHLSEDAQRDNGLRAENERLQRILDSRPAINAGLPETYIKWSQGIYVAEYAQAVGHDA